MPNLMNENRTMLSHLTGKFQNIEVKEKILQASVSFLTASFLFGTFHCHSGETIHHHSTLLPLPQDSVLAPRQSMHLAVSGMDTLNK